MRDELKKTEEKLSLQQRLSVLIKMDTIKPLWI